jgi:hypothetical protein
VILSCGWWRQGYWECEIFVIGLKLGEAVLGATITVASTTESATTYGTPYQLFLLGDDPTITVSANGYTSVSQRFDGATTTVKNDFYLEPEHPSYLYRARDLLYRTLRKLDHS